MYSSQTGAFWSQMARDESDNACVVLVIGFSCIANELPECVLPACRCCSAQGRNTSNLMNSVALRLGPPYNLAVVCPERWLDITMNTFTRMTEILPEFRLRDAA